MGKIVNLCPHKAHVMTSGDSKNAHCAIEGFEPELPKNVWYKGVSADEPEQPDAEVQKLVDKGHLVLNTRNGIGTFVGDHLCLGANHFFSPTLRNLVEEFEPGVQRYFEVQVVSRVPIGGKTEHGTYYWLRPPPIIDCVLYPQTKTRADVKGNPWQRVDAYSSTGVPFQWGGGVAFSQPAYIDGAKIEGHHFWMTRQGPGSGPLTHLFTWSQALLSKYRKRNLTNWRAMNDFNVVYASA